jgi:HEAT repeat protein
VPVFRTPVDVEFVVDGASDGRRIFVSEKEQTFSFALGGRPSRVRFDKGGWILKDLAFERPVEEWIEIAEQDDDVIGRLEAVTALKDVVDARAEDCLARVLLSSVHQRVRREAAAGLEAKKGNVAKAALIAALNDKDARVRAGVVAALDAFEQDLEVSAHLVRVLKEDQAYGPRAAAVTALAAMKVDGAFDLAEKALAIPSHQDEISKAALRAMTDVDVDRAAPLVARAATYGTSIDLRHEALALIQRHGEKFGEEDRERALVEVKRGLHDQYSRTRSNAIRALEGLVAVEALDELKRVSQTDRSRRVREAAERAIESIEKGKKKDEAERALKQEVERLQRRIDALSRDLGPAGS